MTGPMGSLSTLLKRYAGDLPHGAIRKEMQQRRLIVELGNGQMRVLKRDYVYSNLDPEIVRQMGIALHDHAATLQHNFVEERGISFLDEIDLWLSRNEIGETKDANARTVRLGVGVYLIYDKCEQGLVK
jgi:hypothetical protein